MLTWCYYYSVDSKPEILQLFKELLCELENILNVRLLMNIYEHDLSWGIASELPSCYAKLLKQEKSLVDSLNVGLLVNKLLRGGEITKGTLEMLKPTEKCANFGLSKKEL